MPNIFDNIEQLLSDALRTTLTQAERADFCVGYFNLRGWGQISDLVAARFDGQDGRMVRILIGMQRPPEEEMRATQSALQPGNAIDGPTLARLRIKAAQSFKEQIEFGLPTAQAEQSLRALAKQLKADQVKVKLFLRYPLHAKLYLIRRGDPITPLIAYMGSSNLTQSGLAGQGELNVDVVEQDAAAKLQRWFNERWEDQAAFDIGQELIQLIETSWAREELISPYLVYLKMIYHLSEDARKGEREFKLPKVFQGVLLDFQTEAVKLAARHLHRRGGVLLGDVVGLGKTMMASAVIKIFEEDQRTRSLILCPPKLKPMWDGYVQRYNLNADVRSIGNAPECLAQLRGRYKLVVIDESHNLRNREGKRYQAIREFIEEQEAACMLITATPYNKQFTDISNQLRLFLDEHKELGMRPENFLRQWNAAGRTEADFRALYQASTRSLRAFEESTDPDDWRNLLRLFMVRRTRSFIINNYATYDQARERYFVTIDGKPKYFPKRDPKRTDFALDENDPNDQYARLYREDIVKVIEDLRLPRYGLANYLLESIPTTTLNPRDKQIIENLNRAGKRLIGFSRTNLFKRLESSGASFVLSIQRHILRNLVTLYALENNLPIPIGTQDVAALDWALRDTDAEWEPDDDPVTEEVDTENDILPSAKDSLDIYRRKAQYVYQTYRQQYASRFKWLSPGYFDETLKQHLSEDAQALASVLEKAGSWNPAQDAKLNALFELLTQTHPSEKVLVFTQFADTAQYLADQLTKRGVSRLACAVASSADPVQLACRFSPRSNEYSLKPGEEELRVLIATDVMAEGQNLQDCAIVVNYDLPWAIVRLIQRAGRVDRIGQENDTILVYSFIPADGVEKVIRLRQRLMTRLEQNQEVVGTDESFFGENAAAKLRDLYTEKRGVLDDDEDNEVDLASAAYGIWNSAPEEARKTVEKLPPVIYATRPHELTQENPDGVLIYVRFPGGENGLIRTDSEGNIISQSMAGILNAAACPPETPALPRRPDHFDLVARGVSQAIAEINEMSGQLGSLRSTSRKVYDRMRTYRDRLKQDGQDTSNLDRLLDAIFRYPLTERAREALGRELRLGITDPTLAQMLTDWYEDDRLVRVSEEQTVREPVILCSLGLRAIT
ncbi:MAG: helicase-related protein [Anaerolineales bacterium]